MNVRRFAAACLFSRLPRPAILRDVPRLVLITVAVALVLGAVVVAARARAAPPVPIAVTTATPAATPAPPIIVDVGGAVAHPSVVHLPAGARVGDAIAAAGGPAPDADLSGLNRAAPLRDGSRVYVPRVGETPPAGSVGTAVETKVDINHATSAEIQTLPGIGPATAAKIVRARAQRPFTKVEELQTRGLVSARVLADIRDLVTVR